MERPHSNSRDRCGAAQADGLRYCDFIEKKGGLAVYVPTEISISTNDHVSRANSFRRLKLQPAKCAVSAQIFGDW